MRVLEWDWGRDGYEWVEVSWVCAWVEVGWGVYLDRCWSTVGLASQALRTLMRIAIENGWQHSYMYRKR